ncbi:DUF2975 domain-containing protein [Kineococcus rhizosphaerae]|uniref:DUF2975 family protein n=1 Tax=Kineococcus rhizosphaerae TaxID=559628 RepID=A0A2T0R1U4_9ACTN|nr:DUF2975 domain-containing protein [Kineococcus rhizosphaerae]PRY13491.1 Protein of unknown function (DUF2975) [Kineococcus rhizosphaerae]
MAYRLSMAPRIARRFGVHTRPHVIALCAFFARRIGILCLVVAALQAVNSGPESLPVQGAGGPGTLISPIVPEGVAYVDGSANLDGIATITVDPTRLEGALAGGSLWLVWLCVGLGAIWSAALLRRFAEGDPFAPGNAQRLRSLAACVLVATHVAPLLKPLATHLVIARLGIGGLAPVWGSPVHPSLLVVLLLLLLAGALAEGRRLQLDSEGLV